MYIANFSSLYWSISSLPILTMQCLLKFWSFDPNCKIYLSKLLILFDYIENYICINCRLQIPRVCIVSLLAISSQPLEIDGTFVQTAIHISISCKIYLSKLQNLFVKIATYNCLNLKIYLSKLYIANSSSLYWSIFSLPILKMSFQRLKICETLIQTAIHILIFAKNFVWKILELQQRKQH